MKHKVKVVRLPTEDKNNLVYVTVSQDREPIKEGDYTIFRNKVIKLTADDIHPSMIERCKGKIIATSDPKLINSQWKSLLMLHDYNNHF